MSTRLHWTRKTAKKVIGSDCRDGGEEQKLTTLMITHNTRDAIQMGNRPIMMHEGNIIYDGQEEKKHLYRRRSSLQI